MPYIRYKIKPDTNKIIEFWKAPYYSAKFGSSGTGDGQFQNQEGIAVNDNNIFVVDSGRDDVQIFDLSGTFISKFGGYGTGDGQFMAMTGIAINYSNIYVVDFQRSDVQVFDLNGTFISKFGSNGTGNGQFQNPQAIAATNTNICVVDNTRYDIQIFSTELITTKTIIVREFCDNSILLKYLNKDGQYRFFGFNKYWERSDKPKEIGRSNKIITSLLSSQTDSVSIGYRNERTLDLVAENVSQEELTQLADIW